MFKILVLNRHKDYGRFIILGVEILGTGFALGTSTGKYQDMGILGFMMYIVD